MIDDVIQQVRTAREAYARSLQFDLRAIVADLRAQDERGDLPVVRLSPRRIPRPEGGLPGSIVDLEGVPGSTHPAR